MRKQLSVILAATVMATLAVVALPAGPAGSTPVATTEEEYSIYGRVFPDPHGCQKGAPDASPWAKGKVCAVDFLQFDELLPGLRFLEEHFSRYMLIHTLSEDFDCSGKPVADPDEACKDFRSAGIPVTADTGGAFRRERLPLYMTRVTDESVPDKNKKYFVFPLSIHGIEHAGAEGGTRAIEDLVTWAACENDDAPDFVDCAAEEPIPHPLMEADPKGSILAGDALKRSVIYFVWPNPDGWNRGQRSTGTQFFQRYNGNGVDLNRDWPEQGYTFEPYTPWSEPESKAYGKVLQAVGPKDKNGNAKWHGGIDLHGQLNAPAFSYTLLGGTERPYDKDQRVLQTVKGAWQDASKRLAWSTLIKPNDAPADDPRLYGVQWGTIWDTIDYTVTGAFGNWIDSPIGLNADGIDNEMSFSHLSNCGVGSCYEQDIEQLHVDGNKSLIYSMINYTLKPEDTTFRTKGKVGYLFNKKVIKAKTKRKTGPTKYEKLPQQKDIDSLTLDPSNDYTYEFNVKDARDGVYNGGIAVTLTCANVQGVGSCSVTEVVLQRKKPQEHPGEEGEEWETVSTYYNQGVGYQQAGQALHANYPTRGKWRVRAEDGETAGAFSGSIDFTKEKGWEDPGQIGYKVTSMNFWKDLKPFTKPRIEKVTPKQITSTRKWMKRFDTIVITNKVYKSLAKKLRKWVAKHNGNLVLTDAALGMVPAMGFIGGKAQSFNQYAGYINFMSAKREVTYNDKLSKNVNQKGAAEGSNHRHQTYEPVPLGMALGEDGLPDSAPIWFLPYSDWSKKKKGQGNRRVIGTSGNTDQVSFGELQYKGGRVRFIGALLPDPTEKFYHPFGLANYALTFTGYQLLKNSLSWVAK